VPSFVLTLLTLLTSVSFVVMPPSEQTTLYLRGIPREAAKEAKAAAARRGMTLAAFVTEAMTRSIAQPGSATPSDLLEADFAWYEAHREALSRKYEGRYVAIVDRAVVDHDRDFAALAQRVFLKFGMRSVLMPKVTRTEKTLRVRSPRRTPA
jgi:hypothetical protein